MKILIFGGSGLVGSKFIELHSQKSVINAPGAQQVNILSKDQILKVVEEFNPDAVVNFAAYTNVEEAEKQAGDKTGICFQINAIGAKNIAEICQKNDKHLTHVSTEYVFDGEKDLVPYIEEDKPNPINWYGVTKREGEELVLGSEAKLAIARISMPFSAHYQLKQDVARYFLAQLREKRVIKAVDDQRITPTLVDDIANALIVLIENKVEGIYHISSKDSASPAEFAKTIAEIFELDYSLVESITLEEFNKSKQAKLLKYSWLNPQKFEKEFGDQILHTVEESLLNFKFQIDSGGGFS